MTTKDTDTHNPMPASEPLALRLSAGLGVVGAVQAAKFQRVPLADLTNPQKRGPLMTYQDYWWAVDDEDNVFFYEGKSYSPQCNTNRLIVERHLAMGRATRAVLVPWAWVKFDISDYA